MDRFELVINGIQEHFQQAARAKRVHSNRYDFSIVSSSTDQVRFHPSFENLDQAAGIAKVEVAIASATNFLTS